MTTLMAMGFTIARPRPGGYMYHLHVGAGGLFGLGMLAGVWMTSPRSPSAITPAHAAVVSGFTASALGSGPAFASTGATPTGRSLNDVTTAAPEDLVLAMAGHATNLAKHARIEQKIKFLADACDQAYAGMPSDITGAKMVPSILKDPDFLAVLQEAGMAGCATLHLPINQLIDPTMLASPTR